MFLKAKRQQEVSKLVSNIYLTLSKLQIVYNKCDLYTNLSQLTQGC